MWIVRDLHARMADRSMLGVVCLDVSEAHLRRQDLLDLGDGHHWHLPDEEEEPHEEPAKGAEEDVVVHPRRVVSAPLPWLQLARERRDDDDEALEPHADVDEDRQDEKPRRVAAELLREQRDR